MLEFQLYPHPDSRSLAAKAIRVTAARQGGTLLLSYILEGALDAIRWPPPVTPIRTDDLWKHTCFEAFIQVDGEVGYTELNVSPSGLWASYTFDDYRHGMRPADAVAVTHPDKGRLSTSIDLPAAADNWRLGLSAVIEETYGTKSYWALVHAPGPPDFHNPDCFIAALPAPMPP